MGFLSPIKLGRPRKELLFAAGVQDPAAFAASHAPIESVIRNATGEEFRRVIRRSKPTWRVTVNDVQEPFVEDLTGLLSVADEFLSFVFHTGWRVPADKYLTPDDLTHVTLKNVPATKLGTIYKAAGGADTDIVNIDGVFTTYDVSGGQGGTNHFTSGSYNAATRQITLGTALPNTTDPVFVNWNYAGALVRVPRLGTPHPGGHITAGEPRYSLSFTLIGV